MRSGTITAGGERAERSRHLNAAELYLRTIYEMIEETGTPPARAPLARRLGLTRPTIVQRTTQLVARGLLEITADNRLALSAPGHLVAVRVVRRHRLVERLLVDLVGLEWFAAHGEATRWQHVVSEKVERLLVDLLDDPMLSPYGDPIPALEGPEFDALVSSIPQDAYRSETLLELARPAPRIVRIVRVHEPVQEDRDLMRDLWGGGVLPGAEVRLLAARDGRDAAVRLGVGDDALLLSEEAGRWITAQLCEPPPESPPGRTS